MFICQITGKQSKPLEKLHKVIALTRPKNYTKWVREDEGLDGRAPRGGY